MRLTPLVLVLAAACAVTRGPVASDTTAADVIDETCETDSALPDFEKAPAESQRIDAKGLDDTIADGIDTWFDGNGSRRMHVQLDRPMYKPGETVWVKSWNLATRALDDDTPDTGIFYELVNPRGQVVETKEVLEQKGTATNDFVLGGDAPGGLWKLRARTNAGETEERPFVVANYQPPRIDKDLEFVREAYGAGDRVEALVELEKTGNPLANHPVKALIQLDGETILETDLVTDKTGAVLVSGELPAELSTGDGLLTVLVEDGGVTESISRSLPIVLADLNLELFPEGGDLVAGLPGRVYFEGTNRHGEPADVEGYIEDDRGERLGTFASMHDGMGRFELTPELGRTYTAHITKPEGIEAPVALPSALSDGCVVRTYDDVHSTDDDIRVGVRCAESQKVVVAGVLREQTVDTAAVKAGPDKDTVVHLEPDSYMADQQGAVRVTVFDWDLNPVAERLVYRNRGRDLQIEVTPDKADYGPRDSVTLDIVATDPSGDPIEAELALAVVDDSVLQLADDENGHMLTRLYLEPELNDSPKDPGWYFDAEKPEGARGLDLVMGTKGFRRFEWKPVWDYEEQKEAELTRAESRSQLQLIATRTTADRGDDMLDMEGVAFANEWADMPVAAAPAMDPVPMGGMPMPVDAKVPMAQPMPAMEPAPIMAGREMAKPMARRAPAKQKKAKDMRMAQGPRADFDMAGGMAEEVMMLDELGYLGYIGYVGHGGGEMFVGHGGLGRQVPAAPPPPRWAPVRVFPKPEYKGGFNGTRNDFRDTVLWSPKVTTDKGGHAKVSFPLSDAVTSFRVTAEGVGSGYAGHSESTFRSVLPVSIDTKLPVAVSAGDQLMLPVTVDNSRDKQLDVRIETHFSSELLTSTEGDQRRLSIDGGASDTVWVPVEVGQGSETVRVRLEAHGGGMHDKVERDLLVVPPGFPKTWSAAGELAKESKHSIVLGDTVPHSLSAKVTWHPSTVSTLMTGMEGLIQTPGGCFEQTSSTNWPNVAILDYLDAHGGDPRLKVQSSQALNAGYSKLTGYQIDRGGFETWGSGPGKEALSAFGLLQFQDMSEVMDVDPSILDRDVKYLMSVRDGKGGYTKTGESAHGYGSAPAEVLNGFITYALVTTGHGNKLMTEVEAQAKVAKTTNDPYVLAMATRTLAIQGHPGARAAAERLANIQAKDGSFPGAVSSITRSYEANLMVEATALSALALMEVGGYQRQADNAAQWLINARQGAGTWGATQATALALGALTTHAETSRRPREGGTLILEVNGEEVERLHYEADTEKALEIDGWEQHLQTGENTVVLRQKGGQELPFTIDVSWRDITPASAEGRELDLTTTLNNTEVKMGETVRMTAQINNRTDRIVPSPIARIGLPAGLEAQTWQLKQLQDRGEIAYFETRQREVTLYWDGIHVDGQHSVNLDLVAAIPGTFTAPASSAYPYYNDDEKAWAGGAYVEVKP